MTSYQLPQLNYSFDQMEPFLSQKQLQIHYQNQLNQKFTSLDQLRQQFSQTALSIQGSG